MYTDNLAAYATDYSGYIVLGNENMASTPWFRCIRLRIHVLRMRIRVSRMRIHVSCMRIPVHELRTPILQNPDGLFTFPNMRRTITSYVGLVM